MATERFIRDMNMCAICAGNSKDAEGGKIDKDLMTVYANVLPICDICKSLGEKTLVGRYINNGKEIQQRFDDQNLRSMAAAARI